MKYDFFKFNRKQIKKRELEEKIIITRYDLRQLFVYQFMFYLCGSLAGINIYSLINKFAGIFVFIVGVGMMVYTLYELERLENDN